MNKKFPFLPQKKLGQNFLLDKNILQKIVNFLPIDNRTAIIEIGSGYGHLTDYLVNSKCYKVIGIEKDKNIYEWLIKNKVNNKIIFLNQDTLNVDWNKIQKEYQDKTLLIVGNLPYHIANSLLINLLNENKLFTSFCFLVQKEVALRWIATPSNYKQEYSFLSVYTNIISETKLLFQISRKNFVPQPLVDGALVYLKIKKKSLLGEKELKSFLSFIKNCFRYRRKTLWNNLLMASLKIERIKLVFEKLNYSSNIRPQEIYAEKYVELYKIFFDKEENRSKIE